MLSNLARERKVQFSMATENYLNDQVILARLAEAEREASNPNTVPLEMEEVFGRIRKQYGYEV